MIRKIVYIGIVVWAFASCTTIKYTSIEVLVPGEVSYPPEVQKVVLVNNAASQPAHLGHDTYLQKMYSRRRKPQLVDTDTVKLDSLGFSCIYSTANTLTQNNFFDEVEVHKTKENTQSGFYVESKLSRNKVKRILEEHDADAVIALDRLAYESSVFVRQYSAYAGDYGNPTVDVNYLLTWRIYYPERHKKVQRITISDTLYWDGVLVGSHYELVPRQAAVSEAIWRSGWESAKKLAPYWEKVDRLYYSSGNTYFKVANAHYKNGEWNEAAEIWEYIYLTYNKRKKGRAAVNLAYISELSDDLDLALAWINKALAAFREVPAFAPTLEYETIQTYKKVLQNRIKDEKKLVKQYDE